MLANTREQLKMFFTNPIFLSCIFSWLTAQLLKTIINLIYGRIHSFSELAGNLLWRTGGMPSSHSALVASMCTTIGFRNGINSDVFMVSLAFFFVTIRPFVGRTELKGEKIALHLLHYIGGGITALDWLLDNQSVYKNENIHLGS